MIVILKPNPNPDQVQGFISWLENKGISVHKSVGVNETIFGLVGDTASLDIGLISALDIVADVKRIQEPYKDANRKFHPEDRNNKLQKKDNQKKNNDEDEEDEFNSNGFINNSSYSGDKYRDVKQGAIR